MVRTEDQEWHQLDLHKQQLDRKLEIQLQDEQLQTN